MRKFLNIFQEICAVVQDIRVKLRSIRNFLNSKKEGAPLNLEAGVYGEDIERSGRMSTNQTNENGFNRARRDYHAVGKCIPKKDSRPSFYSESRYLPMISHRVMRLS